MQRIILTLSIVLFTILTSFAQKSGGKQAALNAVKKEKKVKEAIMTEANVLYVAVIDDGTRRDGYAEYLCAVLKDYGVQMRIKVVKFGSTNSPKRDNAYGILLGESWCK